ncbi:TPA: transposase [Burkholderia cepacia ATCC 25416]|uniref:transposase n=1 Tax=Burkholderia cepacia TaxID=292 RepID=UPI0028594471|nr:transposase [Burkholderia cepacia ATCC 25416]HDV6367398.1 transposase [Burkholderia cepacia]
MSNAGNRAHPHRTYAQAFRQQVIRETLEPGMSVSIVARRHDINANVVFGRRKQYRQGTLNRVDLDGFAGLYGYVADSSLNQPEQSRRIC